MLPDLRTCPNCGAEVATLISDNASGKRFCHYCLPDQTAGIVRMARKLDSHFKAGTLHLYPLADRIRDADG
jgi:reverse gyrase